MSFFDKGKGPASASGHTLLKNQDDVDPDDSVSQVMSGGHDTDLDPSGMMGPGAGEIEAGTGLTMQHTPEPEAPSCLKRFAWWIGEHLTPDFWFELTGFITSFLATITFSLPATFFFDWAAKNNYTQVAALFLFGSYGFTACITAPLHGVVSSYVGRKTVIIINACILSAATIAFPLIPGKVPMLACRCVQGVGASGVQSAMAAFLADHRKEDNPGATFSRFQVASGFSMVMGPPIGGLIYSAAKEDFRAPFLVAGALIGLGVFVVPWILPKEHIGNRYRSGYGETFALFTHKNVIYLGGATIVPMAAFSFLTVTLSDHIRNTVHTTGNLNDLAVSGYFGIICAGYALTSVVMGLLYDRFPSLEQLLVTFGMFFMTVGFVFVGPLPWAAGDEFTDQGIKDTVLGSSLFVLGMGAAMAFVPTAPGLIKQAAPLGGVAVGIMSAVWVACINIAQLVGPMFGLIAVGITDFKWAGVIVACCCVGFVLFFVVFDIVQNLVLSRRSDQDLDQMAADEGLTQGLLDSQSRYFPSGATTVAPSRTGASRAGAPSMAPSRAPTNLTRMTKGTTKTAGTGLFSQQGSRK